MRGEGGADDEKGGLKKWGQEKGRMGDVGRSGGSAAKSEEGTREGIKRSSIPTVIG